MAEAKKSDRQVAAPDVQASLVANWLLGHAEPPSAAVLRAARLAAYAYTVLPPDHPLRASLRSEYVASYGRHLRMKAELQPLLRAWRAGGIPVLLFKGFHLSEFIYPRPGARFHGDVDVLLPPEHRDRAERIAHAIGWHSTRPLSSWVKHSHMAFALDQVGGATRIDGHHEILHVVLPWHGAQRRITRAVWRSSWGRSWDGIEIREPCPVDMLLVALVLQRSWGAEQWQPKPHDIVDFAYITSRFDVSRDALWNRARELGCERTLGGFLERCDPGAGVLDLTPVSPPQRRRLQRRVFRERGPLGKMESLVARTVAAPYALVLALRFVPLAMRVRRGLSRKSDIWSLLDALCAGAPNVDPASPRDPMPRETVVAGTRWATRLVGTGPFGVCLVRALTTFLALRRRGWSVDFVSGVRREGASIVGHAWIEYNGAVLTELDQADVGARFEQNLRYPGATTPAGLGRAPVAPTRPGKAVAAPVPQTQHD